jgi:hypothetical protein
MESSSRRFIARASEQRHTFVGVTHDKTDDRRVRYATTFRTDAMTSYVEKKRSYTGSVWRVGSPMHAIYGKSSIWMCYTSISTSTWMRKDILDNKTG